MKTLSTLAASGNHEMSTTELQNLYVGVLFTVISIIIAGFGIGYKIGKTFNRVMGKQTPTIISREMPHF